MTAAEKEKRKPKFLRKIFESPKKRADRFDPTKTKGAEKKESIFSKFK